MVALDINQLPMNPRNLRLIPRNAITLDTVASLLAIGQPVYIELEPGDMTSYKFYLIPQEPRFAVEGTNRAHIMICLFSPHGASFCYPVLPQAGMSEHAPDYILSHDPRYKNEPSVWWTWFVVCSFIEQIWNIWNEKGIFQE